jgi:hypothetical protein
MVNIMVTTIGIDYAHWSISAEPNPLSQSNAYQIAQVIIRLTPFFTPP